MNATFSSDGYEIDEQLFSPEEVADLRDHYMAMRLAGTYPGDDDAGRTATDPLKKFPRLIQMHHHDDRSMAWLLDPRLTGRIQALTGTEPLAVQTMLYFKPAGARGQALHQDNFYLKVKDSTCIAAWLALDDCDEENGCMRVVPGSADLPILCITAADTATSFTDITVPIPEGMEVRPVLMRAGDVLFFNGSLIHGSYPNESRGRFRRALIGHYMLGDGQAIGEWYRPLYDIHGNEVEVAVNPGGSKCGVWVDAPSGPTVTLVETDDRNRASLRE
ncbi:MAG: phytanoyl-CoA dioxygenase [Armatimonadota bacterium]